MSEKALYKMAGGRMPVEIGGKRYMARKLRPSDLDYIKGSIEGDRKKQRDEVREEIPDGHEQIEMIRALVGDVTFGDIGPYAGTLDGMVTILWLSVRRDQPDAFKDIEALKDVVEMPELMDMMDEFEPLIFGANALKKTKKAKEAKKASR